MIFYMLSSRIIPRSCRAERQASGTLPIADWIFICDLMSCLSTRNNPGHCSQQCQQFPYNLHLPKMSKLWLLLPRTTPIQVFFRKVLLSMSLQLFLWCCCLKQPEFDWGEVALATHHAWSADCWRSWSTIGLSPTIWSVANGTQWSGRMKSGILNDLPSRTTESDSGSGPLDVVLRPRPSA